jgi:hypothetical protein
MLKQLASSRGERRPIGITREVGWYVFASSEENDAAMSGRMFAMLIPTMGLILVSLSSMFA